MLQNDSHPYIFRALTEDYTFKNLILDEKIAIFNFFVRNEVDPDYSVDFQNAMFVLEIDTIEKLKVILFDALFRLDIDA